MNAALNSRVRELHAYRPQRQAAPGTVAIEELWPAYLKNRDRCARHALILHYAPLVSRTVGRMLVGLPPSVDREDLLGYGTVGLIQALEKFDATRDTKFETFALLRIRGAIIDALRQIDWMPRPLRQQSKAIERVLAELETRLGRSATEQELATALGVSRNALRQILTATNHQLQSLEDCLYGSASGEGLTCEDRLACEEERTPHALCEASDLIEQLARALDALPERDRLLLTLYYFEELTMKEIARVLGVSEPRVCQLHSQAVKRMRAYLLARNLPPELAA